MGVHIAKQALHDKLASQITAAEAHLQALKADAEAKVAAAQMK